MVNWGYLRLAACCRRKHYGAFGFYESELLEGSVLRNDAVIFLGEISNDWNGFCFREAYLSTLWLRLLRVEVVPIWGRSFRQRKLLWQYNCVLRRALFVYVLVILVVLLESLLLLF